MLKISTLIGFLAFFFSSWFSDFTVPRLTNSSVDYLLIPLLGYIVVIVAAQLAARIVPEQN